jgi:hypothetical protein
MGDVRVGAGIVGGCGHRMFCVQVAAVDTTVVVVAVSAAVVVAALNTAMLVDRLLAVAVHRHKPQNSSRHCGGQDDF